jgi:hypothetical protein
MCFIYPLVPQAIQYLHISLLHKVLGMELRKYVDHIDCQHVFVLKSVLIDVYNTGLPRSVNVLSDPCIAAQTLSQTEILSLAHYLDDCPLLVLPA